MPKLERPSERGMREFESETETKTETGTETGTELETGSDEGWEGVGGVGAGEVEEDDDKFDDEGTVGGVSGCLCSASDRITATLLTISFSIVRDDSRLGRELWSFARWHHFHLLILYWRSLWLFYFNASSWCCRRRRCEDW